VPTTSLLTQMMWFSNQWDAEVVDHIFATFSCNWYHWLNSGTNLPLSFEGGDLFNLGSTNVAGSDIVNLGVGGRWKPNRNREFGTAYEFPVSAQHGLLAARIYVDAIFRF